MNTKLLTIVAVTPLITAAPTLAHAQFVVCMEAQNDPYAHIKPDSLPPGTYEKLKQKGEARRQQMQAACDEVTKEQEALQRKADIEQQRYMAEQEQQRLMAAERAKQSEQAERLQAIEDAKPINRLFRGYQYFGHARFCHESRDGYLVQYVNDAEMEKAQRT